MLALLDADIPGQEESHTSVIPITSDQTVFYKAIASGLAQGKTPQEIAKYLDRETHEIQSLIKTEQVISELKTLAYSDDADEALENILKGAQFDSVFTLLSLRDNAKSETVRYNAATQLISLATKKPQTTEDEELPTDPVERYKFLQNKIQKLSSNG